MSDFFHATRRAEIWNCAGKRPLLIPEYQTLRLTGTGPLGFTDLVEKEKASFGKDMM